MELLIQEFVLTVLLFIIGASSASFLYLLADRIHKKYYSKGKEISDRDFLASITVGRSKCDKCGRMLSPLDLIPVVNFVFNRGQCPQCGFKIPFKYTLSELILGGLFVLAFWFRDGLSLSIYELLKLYIVLSIVGLFTIIDIEIRKVPNILILPIIGSLLFWRLIQVPEIGVNKFAEYVLAGVFGFLFIYVVNLLTKGRAFGWGDSKFILFMGLLLGKYLLGALYIGVISGAIVGVLVYLFSKKKKKAQEFNKFTIPFIPFLAFGTVVMYLFGEHLIGGFLDDLMYLVYLVNGAN